MKKSVFGILIVIVGTVVWSSQSSAENVKKIALENGIHYLLTTDDQYYSGASLLAKRLSVECEHSELWKYAKVKHYDDLKYNTFLQKRHATRESDDFVYSKKENDRDEIDFSNMKIDQGESNLSKKEIEQIKRLHPGTDKIVIKASNCDKFSYENVMYDIDQIKRDRGGYNSAHILMALGKFRNRGCYKDKSEELSVYIEDLVDELTEAQARVDQNNLMCNGPNIDIYAERALFINDAGYPLKEKWIENILNCQQPDGGWFSPHTTGLSLLIIAATLDDC